METVFTVEGNDEGKCEESGVEKSSSSLSSPKSIADPVVYKLVRVEGDGRLVPATEDELMEVEDFIVDEQVELPAVTNTENVECISDESSSSKLQKESSEGLLPSEDVEDDPKLSARLESAEEALQMVKSEERISLSCGSPDHSSEFINLEFQSSAQHDKLPAIDEELQFQIPLQEIDPSSVPSLDGSICINESGGKEECSNHPDELIESRSSASGASIICTSSKPDLYTDGEICLDNLSIRELHELFKATFGRETTVKDKLWLKRRITMGLTNSCDVSMTSFTIIDKKLVKKGIDDNLQNAADIHAEESDGGSKILGCENSPTSCSNQLVDHQVVSAKRVGVLSEEYYGSEDLTTDQRAAKRVRKPTKRYIEELSEVELGDHSEKASSSTKMAGHEQTAPTSYARPRRNFSSNGRTIVTRLDSLGGSGIHVPFVSRVRRSRPRKNIMALMKKFDPSGMVGTGKLVNNTLAVRTSLPGSECADKVVKARSASGHIQPVFAAEPEKDNWRMVMRKSSGKLLGLKHTDSSEDNSDDSVAAVPPIKGGMRRKHHRAWTLAEVMKLVEGVAKCGTGRWSEIKKLSFASYSYRTSVDLKDKWRNLLKASFAQTPPDDGLRKHAAVPIPAPILLKVRELAEMHGQLPPNLGTSKLASNVNRSVNQTRPGYL